MEFASSADYEIYNGHPFHVEFVQTRWILEVTDFIEIVEGEALALHAMMMTSSPYFILMKSNTLKIINKIWELRTRTDLNICFTLDAGANVHVLYPKHEKREIEMFITNELISFCQNNKYICDNLGEGAEMVI